MIVSITTVAALRAALMNVPGEVTTGPYMIEYSPRERRLDVHPVSDSDEPIPYVLTGEDGRGGGR
jgi:hypothetical protein